MVKNLICEYRTNPLGIDVTAHLPSAGQGITLNGKKTDGLVQQLTPGKHQFVVKGYN